MSRRNYIFFFVYNKMFIFIFLIVFIIFYFILSRIFSIKKHKYKNNLKNLSCCNFNHCLDHGSLTQQYHSNVKATTLVISCMDYSHVEATHDFLEKTRHAQKYDLVSLAGASLGYNQKNFPWTQSTDDHIDLSVKIHGITDIVVIDHMGCGMYDFIYNDNNKLSPEIEETLHRKNQSEFVDTMKRKYPNIVVKTYILPENAIKNHPLDSLQ